jgi:ubiquinone/menaquinone biosynthesis C-methylase UbiE
MKKLLEKTHQAYQMTRTLSYVGEYKLVQNFTKLFSPWVQVPLEPQDKSDNKEFIIKDIKSLYERDAALFSQGILPYSVLTPESPLKHLRRLPKIMLASIKMGRQRKLNITKPSEPEENLPDYFKRNFHWQIDGYLSRESAELYNHQVEILFTGTAQAMRRLLFIPLHEALKDKNHETSYVLELAAGTGEVSRSVNLAFPKINYTVSDLSRAYLEGAKDNLRNKKVNFIQAAAEDLPFKDESQDVIFSVFLFHEIPSSVREKALEEAYRVLRPGGRLIIVDSIQKGDIPDYEWALYRFPIDYHEPFYKGYTEWNMTESFLKAGFSLPQSERGFLTKCVWVDKV